ncbi:hypothetical protein EMQ25_09090 [Arsenicitalea aurantiaca]|uniref:Uncharacterized protein n=1 Tax=Arsenicitalea aurantiaca TaxID=1783274 RepID=A0A433XAE7_9HYPH|nr:hypothetical protein [Arsenicitalea aurantiaca]RUT31024.1 hypothetical protein EMQ25_09090 [Arsenicitalea aurantiaca]
MFLVRSAFWLALAFIVIGPRDVDFEKGAEALSASALAAGQQIVTEQLLGTECDTLHCAGGKALLSAALTSNAPTMRTEVAADPMHPQMATPVPLPRQRPN